MRHCVCCPLITQVVPPRLVEEMSHIVPKCQCFNGYGPTETTVFATGYPISLAELKTMPTIPIGEITAATCMLGLRW